MLPCATVQIAKVFYISLFSTLCLCPLTSPSLSFFLSLSPSLPLSLSLSFSLSLTHTHMHHIHTTNSTVLSTYRYHTRCTDFQLYSTSTENQWIFCVLLSKHYWEEGNSLGTLKITVLYNISLPDGHLLNNIPHDFNQHGRLPRWYQCSYAICMEAAIVTLWNTWVFNWEQVLAWITLAIILTSKRRE